MQQESLWRYALAQQIAAYARANPNVAAVLVEGSVAKDDADRFSDLDLAVFWTRPPSARERSGIVPGAKKYPRRLSPSHREAGDWAERSIRDGVATTCGTRRSRPPSASWPLSWSALMHDSPVNKAWPPCVLHFLSSTQRSSRGGSNRRLPIRTT